MRPDWIRVPPARDVRAATPRRGPGAPSVRPVTEDHDAADAATAADDAHPCLSAEQVAHRLGAKYLVAFTHSGDSARRLSRLRSEIPILAFTPIEQTQAELTLTWGVETFLVPMVGHTDDMIRQVDLALTQSGKIAEGELVIIVAGSPPGVAGHTNMIRVRRIGAPL